MGVDAAEGMAAPLHWYVAIVSPRHEKAVARQLSQEGIDTYVATQEERRIWRNGRRSTVERVVIPSVVFIRCDEPRRLEIVRHPSILRFMVNRTARPQGGRAPVAVIPEPQLTKLRFMLGHTDNPVTFDPATYRVDDDVRVVRGPLRGLEGRILRQPDGTHTLTIVIDHLGGATLAIDPLDVAPLN